MVIDDWIQAFEVGTAWTEGPPWLAEAAIGDEVHLRESYERKAG